MGSLKGPVSRYKSLRASAGPLPQKVFLQPISIIPPILDLKYAYMNNLASGDPGPSREPESVRPGGTLSRNPDVFSLLAIAEHLRNWCGHGLERPCWFCNRYAGTLEIIANRLARTEQQSAGTQAEKSAKE